MTDRQHTLRESADRIAKQRETLTGSAVYRHTVQVYDYLYENSELNELDERIFRGSISDVINEISPSKRYYSPIRRLLESPPHSPCIEVYQRGTGKQDSIIRLMQPPPEEWAAIAPEALTRPATAATMSKDDESEREQRIASIEKILTGLKEVSLVEVLSNYERRLRRLESQTGDKMEVAGER